MSYRQHKEKLGNNNVNKIKCKGNEKDQMEERKNDGQKKKERVMDRNRLYRKKKQRCRQGL